MNVKNSVIGITVGLTLDPVDLNLVYSQSMRRTTVFVLENVAHTTSKDIEGLSRDMVICLKLLPVGFICGQ